MLLALWPLIASPQDRALEWWQNFGFRLTGYWPASLRYFGTLGWNRLVRLIQRFWPNQHWREAIPRPVQETGAEPKGMVVLLVLVPLVVLLSIVAVIPGSITVQTYYAPAKVDTHNDSTDDAPDYFEDWLIRRLPEAWLSVAAHQYDVVSCTSLAQAEKSDASMLQVMIGPCSWFNLGLFQRNLDLRETRLVPKEVSLSLLTRAIDQSKPIRDAAFKEFDGLNLRKRDLRFANLYGAVLPKADLRRVQFQGAILREAYLQGANLAYANLQGADLVMAELQGAKLRETQPHGSDWSEANLNGLYAQSRIGVSRNSASWKQHSDRYSTLKNSVHFRPV